jgi:hypothetical protein
LADQIRVRRAREADDVAEAIGFQKGESMANTIIAGVGRLASQNKKQQ